MIKSIHIVLAGALLMCSFAFALDKPIKAKSSQNTMLIKKDVMDGKHRFLDVIKDSDVAKEIKCNIR